MEKVVPACLPKQGRFVASFTLVELLTVMAIIAILAGLALEASSSLMNTANRNRAKAEIKAMSVALDAYKNDNGAYPAAAGLTASPNYPLDPTATAYQTASQTLYSTLSGQSTFTAAPTAGVKSYFPFKINQIGSPSGTSYVQDPWRNAYGYSTASPNNGSGFYDLWSTSGSTTSTNSWIQNW